MVRGDARAADDAAERRLLVAVGDRHVDARAAVGRRAEDEAFLAEPRPQVLLLAARNSSFEPSGLKR